MKLNIKQNFIKMFFSRLTGLHLLEGLVSLKGKLQLPSNWIPATLLRIKPMLLNRCSNSFLVDSIWASWQSNALTRPSEPPNRAFNSWTCCEASARQTSRLCFWSSSFRSLQRPSSSLHRSSCSLARHRSSSSSDLERSFPNSCRVTSKLLSKSTICVGQQFKIGNEINHGSIKSRTNCWIKFRFLKA